MMLELAGIAFVTLAFVYGTRKKTSDSVVKQKHDQSIIRLPWKYLSVADGGVCDETNGY